MTATAAPRVQRVPTYCYQCVAGPDLLTVKVEDGVATEIEPNFCAAAVHPGGGKVCVKAYGLVQKTYNPHRVLTPMKRSNPKKGRHEDPGFVPISWDEAFELISERLLRIRAAGLTDAVTTHPPPRSHSDSRCENPVPESSRQRGPSPIRDRSAATAPRYAAAAAESDGHSCVASIAITNASSIGQLPSAPSNPAIS